MKKFLSKIFSIDNQSELRYIITIFGIKISLQKREIAQKRKQNPYYYYEKNNIDITTVPPATGTLRLLQLANLAMLLEFDEFCKKHNIHYWLDGGTLMGAVRHKGFIPWDDDIDLGIFRKDYNKLIEILNQNETDFYLHSNKTTPFLKIKHKGSDLIFLDLFPVDEYGEIIPVEQQLKETIRIKNIVKKLKINNCYTREKIIDTVNKEILTNKIPAEKEKIQYIWGIDFCHTWKNWFTNYDVYFPFKTIKFEGYDFPCMNNPDNYLTRLYGNYMAYPKKIRIGHNGYKDFSEKELLEIHKIIKEHGLEKDENN